MRVSDLCTQRWFRLHPAAVGGHDAAAIHALPPGTPMMLERANGERIPAAHLTDQEIVAWAVAPDAPDAGPSVNHWSPCGEAAAGEPSHGTVARRHVADVRRLQRLAAMAALYGLLCPDDVDLASGTLREGVGPIPHRGDRDMVDRR